MKDGRNSKTAGWDKAGRELLETDPARFEALLELAERIARIHRDPLSVPRKSARDGRVAVDELAVKRAVRRAS